MNIKTTIGIDPGVEGAIVVLSPKGEIMKVCNMPIVETEVPKKKKKAKPGFEPKKPKKESLVTISKKVDFLGLCSILKPYLYDCLVQDAADVCVEEISHLFALPAQTNFKLGHSFGVIHSAIQRYADEFYIVPVKKWQAGIWEQADMVYKDAQNKKVDPKATTKNAFKRIFPDYQGINSDGVRDAALIAKFALSGGL